MNIYILILLSFLSINLSAQDNIVKRDGTEIQAKILEIDDESVKYQKDNCLSCEKYSIPKSQIFVIEYENGTRDVFKLASKDQKDKTPLSLISDSLRIRDYTFLDMGFKMGFFYSTTYQYYRRVRIAMDAGVDIEVGNVFYFKIPHIGKKFNIGINITWVNFGLISGHPYSIIVPYTGNVGPQLTFVLSKSSIIDTYLKPGISFYHMENQYQPLFITEIGIVFRHKSLLIGMSGVISPTAFKNYDIPNANNKDIAIYNFSHFGLRIGMIFKKNKRLKT